MNFIVFLRYRKGQASCLALTDSERHRAYAWAAFSAAAFFSIFVGRDALPAARFTAFLESVFSGTPSTAYTLTLRRPRVCGSYFTLPLIVAKIV